jgi:hypothetical protein
MLRLIADENFNGDILRGLLLRDAGVDVVRVQDVDLAGADDPRVLAWAAANGRILLTHDRASMPAFAFSRVAAGEPMPGVFAMSDRMPVGEAIREIQLILACSEQAEWNGRVVHLPFDDIAPPHSTCTSIKSHVRRTPCSGNRFRC